MALEVHSRASTRRGRLAAAHARLIERLDELQRQLDEALVVLTDAAQHDNERLVRERDEALTQLARLEVREREATDELQRVRDDLAAFERTYEKHTNELRAELRNVTGDLRKALAERDEVHAEADLLRGKIDELQREIDDCEPYRTQRDEARQLVANCKTRMRDLEQRVEAAEKATEKATNELRSRAQAARQKMLAGLNALLHDVEFDEAF